MRVETASLLVDLGNSRVKWALSSPSKWTIGQPFATHRLQSLAADVAEAWGTLPTPSLIVVANVAGPLAAAAMQEWAMRHWGLAVSFVQSQAQGHGVVNGYRQPEKLGVDRWVALVGARHTVSGPVCVADCGTAITLDVMDGHGTHLGGAIAPGIMLMRQALASGTDALPLADATTSLGLARETVGGIASGTVYAAAGLIERCQREAVRHLGGGASLLLTGGDADRIAPALSLPASVRPALVLEGLKIIAAAKTLRPKPP